MPQTFDQRVRELFDEALERPKEKRLHFLELACEDAPGILREVTRLLAAREAAQSFLSTPAAAPTSAPPTTASPLTPLLTGNPEKPTQRINRYVIKGELGRGAMGVVYEAVDPVIGRSIALKVLHAASMADQEETKIMEARLFREASSAGRLDHPGIVTVFDVGSESGMAFIAMERVDGPTLHHMLGIRRCERAQSLDILRQSAAALDYAHGENIVHRDIKPANIMLHKGTKVKIADFGIAKVTTPDKTQTRTVMGTPSYMSPEQIQNFDLNGRSDQFSLAVVAYELLTGKRPFVRDNLASLFMAIVDGERPSARALDASLPASVDEVFFMALNKLPENRFATCSAFINALEGALRDIPHVPHVPQVPVTRIEPVIAQPTLPPPPPIPHFDQRATHLEQRVEQRSPAAPNGSRLAFVLGAVGVAALIGGVLTYKFVVDRPAEKAAAPIARPGPVHYDAPAVSLFSANPDRVAPGGAATIRWWVTGASEVVINNAIGRVAEKGSIEVQPPKSTEYILTATGAGGNATATVTVEVAGKLDSAVLPILPDGGMPKVLLFRADPASVKAGEQIRLAWKVEESSKVRIDNGVGEVPAEATRLLTPDQTTTYLLTATGKSGQQTVRRVTVRVLAATIVPSSTVPTVTVPDANHARQLYESAMAKRRAGQAGPAMAEMQRAAEAGEPRAMLEMGKSVSANDAVGAARWFRKAADAGNTSAMVFLAALYAQGSGVAKNLGETVEWLRKAAAGGNAVAMDGLGQMYLNGQGVEKSASEAAGWFRMGTDAGNALAMFHLAAMFETGTGVAKDPVAAAELYQRSAKAGYGPAKAHLAQAGSQL